MLQGNNSTTNPIFVKILDQNIEWENDHNPRNRQKEERIPALESRGKKGKEMCPEIFSPSKLA